MDIVAVHEQPSTPSYKSINLYARTFALGMVFFTFVFLFNNFLIVGHDWPGIVALWSDANEATPLSWLQLLFYLLVFPCAYFWSKKNESTLLIADSDKLSRWTSYVVRAVFWSVLLIGIVDSVISFLRIEGFLGLFVSEGLERNLGIATFRGMYVHYPIIALSFIIAFFVKKYSVAWLALMVVLSELLIVITRFVFSYEQTFMGDLVRFWYAGLFLLAAAYTLKSEGHVRVDVLYAGKSIRFKAWVNIMGILLLGLPLCWTILGVGMWESTSVLNSPIATFEISQASYGLYIKYLLAAYLVVFALTMIMQFSSYFLKHIAILVGEVNVSEEEHEDVGA
ncbi:TRAP transporter small permease subunit [Reinekea sp.]|uniref:TRAP transporter small permease subunit n=1 Tax=Reinekea sp. TaxID=1970455 RepID=UPI003988DA9D